MRDQPRRALHDEIAGRIGWTDAMVGEMSRRRGVICQCEIKHPIPARTKNPWRLEFGLGVECSANVW
jgi:hypothetical protein